MNGEKDTFAASNLRLSQPYHDDHTPTFDIPLEDSRQVQFTSRSPSMIPSHFASEQGTVLSSPLSSAPQLPSPQYRSMHQNHEGQRNITAFNGSNFATDTFEPDRSQISDKTLIGEHEMQVQNSNVPVVHDRGRANHEGFIPLPTTDGDLQHLGPEPPRQRGIGNAIPPSKVHRQRSPLMRILLGPLSRPWFSWLSGLGMAITLIVELVKNSQLTGSVIQLNPINPMIGPSFTVLINLGAKFSPCMRTLPDPTLQGPYASCFTSTETCTLEQLCGFGGFGPSNIPNQAFRFFTAIFLHAGIVHYLVNMFTHLTLGAALERELGIPRYVLMYIAAGLWGNVLSAMLAQSKQATMGCSGALFGLIGYMFVDLVVNWRETERPWLQLFKLIVSTAISLVIGLLPGLDNFAHLGGFVVGILMGILVTPTRANASRRVKLITWGARVSALIIIIILFAVTITTYYNSPDPSQICPGCKYLSCLPVNGWCDM